MGLFNKKRQEDEWEVLPDDYDYDDTFDDYISAPVKKSSKPKPSKKSNKQESKKSKKKKHEKTKEKIKNQRPEVYKASASGACDLGINEMPDYGISYLEKESGYVYVNKERPKSKLPKIWIITISIILSIASLGVIGYINTDFDDNGTAYVIPLNIHYKRKYAQMSDNVLDYINDINDDLQSNITNLPSNYLLISDEMTKEVDTLKAKTNELSRYTNIPKDFQSYHSSLLNFSLLTQEFLTNLINNYSNNNYEEFAYNGMNDFRNYLSEMNSLRVQMDSVLFSNQSNYTSEYKSKTKINKSTNKSSNSKKSYFNTSKKDKSDDK